ncbi:MAG: hypothetical protein ACPL0B_01585 [Anaerolineales bacterium]
MSKFDTEILFPPRLLIQLRNLRGEKWREFVDEVINKSIGDVERVAFIYFMARLNACATCHGDSLRAIQGCSKCSQQVIKRFRGSDEELIHLAHSYKQEMYGTLTKMVESKND